MPDRQWWRLVHNAATPDVTEIVIHDEIGEDFWGEGVSARELTAQIRATTTPRILVRINSPGGNVFDGLAIYNALNAHPATVDVRIDGLAASTASVIAMAGQTITAPPTSMMMIHNPSARAGGDHREMQRMADLLTQVRGMLRDTYLRRWYGTAAQLEAALDAETWYTATEAAAVGLVDMVDADTAAEPAALAAVAAFDLTTFRHVPPALRPITATADQESTMPQPPALPTAASPETTPRPAPVQPHTSRPPTTGEVFSAALRRRFDPHGWDVMSARLQAMAQPPGDGAISVPGDVAGILPEPIVQEIHSWMRGRRPVSELFGLRGLPYQEGDSFNWPYVAEYPDADQQLIPGQDVYLTNIKILGKPFTKVTIGAYMTRPFQSSWTSPSAAAEVGAQMVKAYAQAYERMVCADLVASTTANVELDSAGDADAVADAILQAIENVDAVTGDGADVIVASRDQVKRLRALRDGLSRPIYPLINPTNADGQVIAGELWVEGIKVTTSPALPAATLIVGHSDGYRTFDDGGNYVTHEMLSKLSTEDVVYGFGAFGPLDAAAFTKIGDTVP